MHRKLPQSELRSDTYWLPQQAWIAYDSSTNIKIARGKLYGHSSVLAVQSPIPKSATPLIHFHHLSASIASDSLCHNLSWKVDAFYFTRNT